jgi:hypothetical protein
LQQFECLGLDQLLDRTNAEQSPELLKVSRELVYWETEYAVVQSRGVRWLLDAFFELDVLVPESVTVPVEAYKMGAALKEAVLSALVS